MCGAPYRGCGGIADEVRACAASSLGEMRDSVAVPRLIDALKRDPDIGVQVEVAEALGYIGGERALETLLSILNRTVDIERRWEGSEGFFSRAVVRALGRFDNAIVMRPLFRVLENDSFWVVWDEVEYALSDFLQPETFDIYVEELERNKSLLARELAVKQLRELKDLRAMKPLLKTYLNDESERVRMVAYRALRIFRNPEAFRLFSKIFRSSKSPGIRKDFVLLIANQNTPDAFKLLRDILRSDRGAEVRRTAAGIFGESKWLKSVPDLIDAMANDSDTLVRAAAADALGIIGDPGAVRPLLAAFIEDGNHELHYSVLGALYNIIDDSALQIYTDLLKNKDTRMRELAVKMLGNIITSRTPEEDGALSSRRGAGSKDVFKKAFDSICDSLSGDASADVRLAAAEVLEDICDPGAKEVLKSAIAEDKNAAVREAAKYARQSILEMQNNRKK